MLLLVLAFPMAAQNLPLLPSDPAVKSGVLPNGMTWYMVTNPTTDGIADFALVQKMGTAEAGDMARTAARDAMTSLPRLRSASTQSFLASHGVAPSKDGFVRVSENATVYHFDNILLSEEAVDSVLLVLMDIADRGTSGDPVLAKWCTPSDQAVVISGDIDAASLTAKLKMLSYMTPSRTPQEREDRKWEDKDSVDYQTPGGALGKYVTVTATWTSPRTPKEYMNTVQPAIYSLLMNEIGMVARDRISRELKQNAVPAASVSYKHVSSVLSCGDENFSVSVTVAPEHVQQAVETLAKVMASLDKGTATEREVTKAKNSYLSLLEKRAGRLVKSNAEYVDHCTYAFLYNAPLTTPKDVYSFLKYRDIDASAELGMFNRIASALLDGQKNLSVSCLSQDGQVISKEDLKSAFCEAWDSEYEPVAFPSAIDSMPLPPAGLPIKLKSTRKDPVSGGILWTFSNGFKVVYKRQETGRQVHYALALNGGYGNIKDLYAGEGAYVADYLNLNTVSGMNLEEFRLALEDREIEYSLEVNLSNTVIQGRAHESDMDLLMRVLLASVNERAADSLAFDYYKSCQNVSRESIRGSVHDRILAIDSLMCPGYVYSSLKHSGEITDEFPAKVDAFWQQQRAKTNDGVLVLIGNIEETKLRKLLQNYIGSFQTTDKAYPRTNVRYQPVSGSTAYTLKGDRNSVDVVLSLRLALTPENYMASEVAAGVLKQMLSEAISGTGLYLRFAHTCRIYPQERFSMMITLAEADPAGFGNEMRVAGTAEALAIIRKVLTDLPDAAISDADVKKHKEVLKGQLALKMQDPQYWTQAIVKRYLDGKDFTTSYAAKIDAVTAAKVKAILAPLSTTSRVEYIIEK